MALMNYTMSNKKRIETSITSSLEHKTLGALHGISYMVQ